jgi:hypothetical protein
MIIHPLRYIYNNNQPGHLHPIITNALTLDPISEELAHRFAWLPESEADILTFNIPLGVCIGEKRKRVSLKLNRSTSVGFNLLRRK